MNIDFKSRVAGGRKSDCQITIESGPTVLSIDDDLVLADEGFRLIESTVEKLGKKVTLVMPPFSEKKRKEEYSKEETEDTRNVAGIRIRTIERIMQRLRTYGISNDIPGTLFHVALMILYIFAAFWSTCYHL